jgi:hypothetical protein
VPGVVLEAAEAGKAAVGSILINDARSNTLIHLTIRDGKAAVDVYIEPEAAAE